jgi:hypothetical protein
MQSPDLHEQALAFVRLVASPDPAASAARADDILLLLYRVRDTTPTIAGLEPILHDLEADPDALFHSEDRRRGLIDILRRVAAMTFRSR